MVRCDRCSQELEKYGYYFDVGYTAPTHGNAEDNYRLCDGCVNYLREMIRFIIFGLSI